MYFAHLLIRAGDQSQAAWFHLLPSTTLSPYLYAQMSLSMLLSAPPLLSDGLSEFRRLPRSAATTQGTTVKSGG